MESVYFQVDARLPDCHQKFAGAICLRSVRSRQPELSLAELLTFLSHAKLSTSGLFNPSKQKPYTEQIRLFCSECGSKGTCFWIFADPASMTFSIRLKEHCPLQQWQMEEIETTEGNSVFKYTSNPEMLVTPVRWERNHPFRRIGKHILKYPHFPLELKERCQRQWFSHSQQHHQQLEREHCQSLEDVVSMLEGKVDIYITHQPNNLKLQYGLKGVVALNWMAPWAGDEFGKCNFVELDTSFTALKPYVYAIPFAIRANEGVPLGLIIGLSESIELYKLFFNSLLDLGITEESIKAKPFLSDQHAALMSICAGGKHFLCIRHLIESFGSNCFLGQVARRLALSSTQESFSFEMEACAYDMLELRDKGKLESKNLERLWRTFGLGLSAQGEVVQNWDVWPPQSIWARADFGVATCSNHVEGLKKIRNFGT
jgi:hypothetical protein